MSEIRLGDAKYWVDKLAIPLIISFTVLGVTWLITERVVYVTPPPNLFNEAYNPFLGTWENKDAALYGFNQLIISRDENNLGWNSIVCRFDL